MPPPHGRCLRLLAALLLTGYIRRPCNFRCWIGRGLVPQCRGRWTARAVKVNYDLDVEKSKAAPGAARKQTWEWKGNSLDDAAFDQERLMEYIQTRPWEIFKRLASTLWIAGGIWLAWRERTEELPAERETPAPTLTTSLARTAPKTARGEALRQGLQKMGVFFVKVGQTAAQRPDIVGDEVAEELKGLQEQSTPFSDDVALRILAEDLRHDGPLAPGVLTPNCHADGPPLLKELNPKFVASASLGQVYRGLMHDGREVALKIQRPGVRDVLGLDWAVATLVSRAYQTVVGSPNDYGQVVDTVAKGVRMELDYYNEAANAEEFAMRHAFLPFVTSPGWIPELMGPPESSRVLALNWYPSRAPKELAIEERRLLVEMAVEACQLKGVQQIQSTYGAFAAILEDGSVVTWGDAHFGGDSSEVRDELRRVQQIQATQNAFAAILEDGSVVSWGDAGYGGDSSSVQDQLSGVQQIQARNSAFAAILEDGSVITWGDARFGGDSSAVRNQLTGVVQIQASMGAFAAILEDGSVVTWGRAVCGGDRSAVRNQLTGVVQIQASMGAFAAIREDESVVAWGLAGFGGDNSAVQDQLKGVRQIQAAAFAFAAILEDGSVVTWGHAENGGDSRAVQDQLKGVQQIQATHRAFAAILEDGSLVTWGDADHGGDSSAVRDQLRGVQQIQASHGAFAAILADGSVVTWGDAADGGDSSAESSWLELPFGLLGDDGRVVFLDFGLMDRVDFGLMESCAAGVRQVLNKDWLDLTHTFQAVRFTPEPMMKNVDFGIAKTPRYEPCGNEEFAVAFQKQLESEEDGQSRFGAMAVALKKLSDRYLMLTPPFIALLCRTFITLEGLLADDPKMSEEYNVYETSLPFAICRLLSPRTRKGGKDLRSAFLKDENNSSEVNWSSLSALLMAGSDGVDSSTSEDKVCGFDLGTAAAVQRRLLLTAEGIALRRLCYQVDAFQAYESFVWA
eukprot:symbB.v1.2.030163.t1/scaffold3356.1/size58521/4